MRRGAFLLLSPYAGRGWARVCRPPDRSTRKIDCSEPSPFPLPAYRERVKEPEADVVLIMSLESKIHSGSAIIGVIGLGYVGLPLLAAFHRAGLAVIGFDVDPKKIDALHRGENYLKH